MNNLTTEQIARVFAMYIGQKLVGDLTLAGISHMDMSGRPIWTAYTPLYAVKIETAKLILRPLSAITDEDAVEVAKINGWSFKDSEGGQGHKMALKAGQRIATALSIGDAIHKGTAAFQYLIQQGYAVPLFIAPGHPDNGKTAIELGLAIGKEVGHE